jgi:hypothetical protein
MKASQYSAKFYTKLCVPEQQAFINVFHDWIQKKKLDELLIDVADYTHVHRGPGVLLVGHESYYGMEEGDGRIGMLYRRRRGDPEEAESGLRKAAKAALTVCKLIEDELRGQVTFDGSEVLFGFDDRLLAPNDTKTFNALSASIESVTRSLYPGSDVSISQAGEPRDCFRARATVSNEVEVTDLLERLL